MNNATVVLLKRHEGCKTKKQNKAKVRRAVSDFLGSLMDISAARKQWKYVTMCVSLSTVCAEAILVLIMFRGQRFSHVPAALY